MTFYYNNGVYCCYTSNFARLASLQSSLFPVSSDFVYFPNIIVKWLPGKEWVWLNLTAFPGKSESFKIELWINVFYQ